MVEVYLFVNPLGQQCLQREYDIVRVDEQLNKQFVYQFVPLLNMQTITSTLEHHHLDSHDLKLRNEISQKMFKVVLDYKAALFQGRKKGRQFLIQLQQQVIEHGLSYCNDIATQTAEEVNLDIDMFNEDRQSQLAKQAFHADQKMANEMGIEHTASAVIFNETQQDYGVLVDDFDYKSLLKLCSKEPKKTNKSHSNHQVPFLRVL